MHRDLLLSVTNNRIATDHHPIQLEQGLQDDPKGQLAQPKQCPKNTIAQNHEKISHRLMLQALEDRVTARQLYGLGRKNLVPAELSAIIHRAGRVHYQKRRHNVVESGHRTGLLYRG
jgi:hypothetical protein